MDDIEQSIKGYYTPGFFHIYLNTNLDISNLNELIRVDKEVFSTFLHEYIHFIQNYTSVSGMYFSHFLLEHISYQIAKIKEQKGEISLPIKVTDDFNRSSIFTLEMIYGGDKKTITDNCVYLRYESEEIQIIPKIGDAINPKKHKIIYKEHDSDFEKEYHFGYLALKEYVAHKIQNKFIKTDHPIIPYTIIDLIIEKELPELYDKEDLKILLCDLSLMDYHPARFFFDSIENLKNNLYGLELRPLEFYNFLFKDIVFNFEGEHYTGLIGYERNFKLIKENLIKSYTNIFESAIFKLEVDWMIHIIEEGYLIRKKFPLFILGIINDDGRIMESLKNIIRKMGTPTFINTNSNGYLIPPVKLNKLLDNVKVQGTLFLAAAEITKLLGTGIKKCNLVDFCEKNFTDGYDPTNYFCYEDPLKKFKEDPCCTLVQLCKTWGITDKKYI